MKQQRERLSHLTVVSQLLSVQPGFQVDSQPGGLAEEPRLEALSSISLL